MTLLARGPTTFGGTFVVPPNVSESTVNWSIEISAVDTNGADAMAFTGGVEVAGQPRFDEPPDLWDPTVTPPSLATAGGTVVIGVSAWDLRGITDGSATVTGPDHVARYVELQPVSADRFEGAFTASANTGPTAVQYGVTVAVHDDIGQESTIDAGTFGVAGRPPAASGTLTLSPSARVFAPVGAGRSATRTVVVRNTGAPGSAPVQATAAVTGRSFAVAGDGSFTLAPGETSTLRISYSPTRPGLDLARLVIRRVDGRQSQLGALLIGLAARRP